VLAHGGIGWKRLVQDAGCLYWADAREGTITRLPKDGGIPLELASGQQTPAGLAIADGFLYWTNELAGTVVRMAAGGGEIETIAEGQERPGPIAAAGVDVVWGNQGDNVRGALMKGGTDGRAPVKIASDQKYPMGIALDEQTIYWTNHGTKKPDYFQNGSVMKMPRALPPAGEKRKRQVVARPQTAAQGIAVDEGWVYWTSFGGLTQSFCDAAVMRRRKRGGAPEVLVSDTRSAMSIAVDATHVYWVESFRSAIRRAPKGGGEAETIADTDTDAVEASRILPHGLAVDERFVYWTVHDSRRAGGAVWKMAK